MRVLQLVTQTRGGPVDHAVDVAVELARRGHDSYLVGPEGDHFVTPSRTGVVVRALDIRAKSDLRGALRFRRLVRSIGPDIVHCQDRRAGLVGRTVLAGLRTAPVYTLHGVPDPLSSRVPGNLAIEPARLGDLWGNLLGERLLARAPRARVVAPCEALATYAVQHIGIEPSKVSVVYNGVGPAWLGPAPRAAAKRTGATRFVWVGVMEPVKRVPALIRAISEVSDAHLVLVGDGPERPRIERTIRDQGVRDRVELVGFTSEPRQYFDSADALVLTSGAEACPMVVLQAMARGLAVIATRVGGIAELILDGRDGLLVAPGDHRELVEALRRLNKDVALREEIAVNAQRRLRENFTVRNTVDGLLDVYARTHAEAAW